ncbi:MAG: NADP-specific glutamate dehydrogenase, partial [Peptococcaceae bacterium]|nr:NADP-specific glutamate dehydrogenase [Peptococcaceae bacterium]
TGKSTDYGGSLIRPESTGYGAVYFTQHLLAHEDTSFEGKIVSLTGYGNVTGGAAIKINELGGKVVTISGSDGYVYDPDGISGEKVDYLLYMRDHNTGAKAYAEKYPTATFYPKEKPWGKVPDVDIYMPCATQNEISLEEAKAIVAQGVKYVIEVSNMPCTNDAIEYMMQHGVVMAPSKAVNAGGVAVSALEMSQNSQRMLWTAEEVDQRLSDIMKGIHDNAAAAAEQYGLGYNLMAGANLAGFEKVARAMYQMGVI